MQTTPDIVGDITDVPSLSGRSVEVVVGAEEPTTFSVHEDLICKASDFFQKAMSGSWKESSTRSIRLESHDSETFQVYLHWLYYHVLPVRVDSPGLDGNAEYLQLAKAYVLGDMFLDGDFKDAVIDAIIDKSTSKASDGQYWYPVGPVIRYIYDNTLHPSKARSLLVDLYTASGHGEWLSDWAQPGDLPKEFLHNLAISLLDKRNYNGVDRPGNSSCTYHEHGTDGKFCYRSKLPKTDVKHSKSPSSETLVLLGVAGSRAVRGR